MGVRLPSPVGYQVYRGGVPTCAPGQSYCYWLAGNGVWKLAERARLRALIPLAPCRVAGLPDLAPVVQVHPGRLAGTLLQAMLADARRLAAAAPREVLYHVVFDGLRMRVLRPQQRGSAATLAYMGGDSDEIVMDLHSHCEMGAFFSGTDDRDELGFRLYAVIGRIFDRLPELALRVGVYGDYWSAPFAMVFGDGAAGFKKGKGYGVKSYE